MGHPMYAAYTILNLECFLDYASKRGMTVTERLAYSCCIYMPYNEPHGLP